jgi:prevent-host-death family protein
VSSRKIAIKNSYFMQYSVAAAKNNLPKLIKAALRGEEVIITKRGEAVVELVQVKSRERKRGFGCAPGLTASLPPGWDSQEEEEKYLADFKELD